MTDFSEVASRYEKSSIVQRSASDRLFDLLGIGPAEDVLDLGCGTGHLTGEIRKRTGGRVVGVDASPGMIEQARRSSSGLNVTFEVLQAENMPYVEAFDVIFCNSTFQWMRLNYAAVLESCRRALRPGGRIGIQAPARKVYSPNFIEVVERVKATPSLRETFTAFEPPWLFLDSPEEYGALFESAGFEVLQAQIERVASRHTPEEVFNIFDTGAAAGYLNPRCYSLPLSEEYIASFRATVREAFKAQTGPDRLIDLTFYRIYLVARKK